MNQTLTDLAVFLQAQGMPCQVVGDADHCVCGVATLEDAGPEQVSFLANPRYEKMLGTTRAGAVVVRQGQTASRAMNLLHVADPYAAITMLIVRLHGFREHPCIGVSKQAFVSPTARIGRNVNIWPFATVGENVVIGDDVTIYPGCYVAPGCRLGSGVVLMPNVVVYEGVTIGDRAIIHAGTVVGNDGLGFAPVGEKWEKIPQAGTVEIGNDVEIGANCSIDRATLGKTVIGSGTKMSNLIAVGHGVKIGENCLLVAQVGLAGSVTVGNHVTMAGQVGVVGHITIGDNATLGAKAGVTRDVPPGATFLGVPATSIQQKKREFASIGKLPEMRQKLRQLEATVEQLRQEIHDLKAAQSEQ